MQKISIFIVYILFIIFAFGCAQEDGKKAGLLPSSKGDRGEMIMVIDSTKWKGELGDALREVFAELTSGLPRPQPLFTVRNVLPNKFRGLLKHHANIVVVTTFDSNTAGNRILQSNFTAESIEKLKADPNVFQLIKENEFAKNQIVMHLFGANDRELIHNLGENKEEIRNFFNKLEKKRVSRKLFSGKLNQGIMKNMEEAHQIKVKIPLGYQLVKDTTSFIWMRHPEATFDKNLFFAYKNYESEDEFQPENIIAWRDSIAKKYIYGDPENLNSFMLTEPLEPPLIQQIDFNGNYAKESRGRWKTNNLSMGGPFLSYTFADQTNGRLYYIEAFLFSPGIQQREIMRELEVILSSFGK